MSQHIVHVSVAKLEEMTEAAWKIPADSTLTFSLQTTAGASVTVMIGNNHMISAVESVQSNITPTTDTTTTSTVTRRPRQKKSLSMMAIRRQQWKQRLQRARAIKRGIHKMVSAGMSHTQIAELCGCNDGQIYQWAHGVVPQMGTTSVDKILEWDRQHELSKKV